MNVLEQAISHIKYYDHSLEEKFYMYDHLPYVNDPGLCGKDSIAVVSGNVIKNYKYKNTEVYPLNNKDEFMRQKLDKLRLEQSKIKTISEHEVVKIESEDFSELVQDRYIESEIESDDE